ncbi:MAG: hydrogenase subunit MbhD domain-containing protein [Acidimicrobiales bacterium]
MTGIDVTILALVAAAGTMTVFTPDPARQAVTLSIYGLCLGMLFLVLAAPDVTLSEIAVNAAVLPLIVLLTIRRIRRPQ